MKHSLKQYAGRALYLCLAQWLPMSYSHLQVGQKKLRALCGKMMLSHCGSDVNIERRAHFSGRVWLGDRSGLGVNACLSGEVVIGNDVMMGPWCTIYARNHRFDDLDVPMDQQGFQEEEPVVIGDDVWIGGHMIILPGVHVGSHSVIGAGAVVTKDVPEWAVVGGNPAAVRKYRTRP